MIYKKVKAIGTGMAMMIALMLTEYARAQTVIFDDFSYENASDPAIESFNRWSIVNGTSGPPSGASYLQSNITFTSEGIMQLRCANSGTVASATHARVETKDVVYFEGTYSARVFFDNSPRDNTDPVIQTFYAISPSSGGQNPATYAEVDFEYLPWDSWNGLYNNNYNNAMWMSSYESARVLTGGLDNDHEYLKEDFGGAWHTLLFRFTDHEHVEYFIDGDLKATLSTRASDGVSVYPDYNMLVSFANWGYPPIEGTSFGSSTALRSSTMQVDWFVHVVNESKTTAEIEAMVAAFRSDGVDRKNRLGQLHGPGVITLTEEEQGTQTVLLYPNPGTDSIFIHAGSGSAMNDVCILDASGRQLLHTRIHGEDNLDVSVLRPGVYLVTIYTDAGYPIRKRFVKE